MKKRTVAILVALMLLGGCGTQPAAPPAEDTPDMEAIIQQSVDEAVQEKMKEYEEEQKKKDEEIARLQDQIEDLTGQSEVPPEEVDAGLSTPENQPESSSSQAEVPSQPEPEPPPQSTPAPKKPAPSSGQGFDLRSLYPGIDFEEDLGEGGVASKGEPVYEGNSSFDAEGFANTAFDLINEARQNKGLHTVDMSSDAMALAEMRVPELEEKYSHTRPDGTRMSKEYLCGEIINENADTPEITVSSWLDSPSHYDIIMAERYHSAGIACYKGTDGVIYWCMLFFQ